MKLIPILKLTPLRNETGQVYKWEETQRLLSPMQIHGVEYQEAVKHTVVVMNNGEHIIVEDSVKRFQEKFEEATK